MDTQELTALLDRLRAEPHETEWLEFKASRYHPQTLGEYISALANAACLYGRPKAYLVFGIQDQTHKVIGTSFDPGAVKGKGNQNLLLWPSLGLQPNMGFEVYPFIYQKRPVVLFDINAAYDRPVSFYGTAYIRVGSSKTPLAKCPDKERRIWKGRVDWSAQICEQAVLDDLDPEAISKARQEYVAKFPSKQADVSTWDDVTFLNKLRLAVRGRLTNTAILLLGRPESSALITPAVARISWILKNDRNLELDYAHFDPPFLLNVDEVLGKIRNLTIRALPSGTLFPVEITQYDPWILREALHNCIAHQDYSLRGRINVVETPDSVLLTNVGSFLPGDVKKAIRQDAPFEVYRNPFLAEAMVQLNMIDTQGGGIKCMFLTQIKRFFPMPDYDLTEPGRVIVRVRGSILDERYTQLLMDRSDLGLWTVILLDKVQKRIRISKNEHKKLKNMGLVEGRYPNLFVSRCVASVTGLKARHIRHRGLNKRYYQDMILELIRTYGPVTRKDIDSLLMDKLPEVLTEEQKRARIHYLLHELRGPLGLIRNSGSRTRPAWILVDSSFVKTVN
jgi:ATP-dependent DNA helicase RecG